MCFHSLNRCAACLVLAWILSLPLVAPAAAQLQQVKDLSPGRDYIYHNDIDHTTDNPAHRGMLSRFVPYQGALYFPAKDDVHGAALWRTDGTAGGTVMVSDVNSSTSFTGLPVGIVPHRGTLYFSAPIGTDPNDHYFWHTQGLVAGQEVVVANNYTARLDRGSFMYLNGPAGIASFVGGSGLQDLSTLSAPSNLVELGQHAYFIAGNDLYRTFGDDAFIERYYGFYTYNNHSSPGGMLAAHDGRVYFTCYYDTTIEDPAGGQELGSELCWTDGSGTFGDGIDPVGVVEFNVGSGSSSPILRGIFNNLLLITADVATNTRRICNHQGTCYEGTFDDGFGGVADTPSFVAYNGDTYLYRGHGAGAENRLWRLGTADPVVTIAGSDFPKIRHPRVVGDSLYFFVERNGGADVELWRTDGSDANTVRIGDVPGAYKVDSATVLNGGLIFVPVFLSDLDQELWSYNVQPRLQTRHLASTGTETFDLFDATTPLPVVLDIETLSTGGEVMVALIDPAEDALADGLPAPAALAPYVRVTAAAALDGLQANLTLTYTDEALAAAEANESELGVWRWDGTTWSAVPVIARDLASNTVTAGPIGGFSDFALAEASADLPVELTTFSAVRDGERVQLAWRTLSETNNAGFEVQRAAGDARFTPLGFVEGRGTTSEGQAYGFSDPTVQTTAVTRYRLKQVDYDGGFRYSPIVEVAGPWPSRFILEANYPNPFNPQTTIRFVLPTAASVRLTVTDALGRVVATLAEGLHPAGTHAVRFEASDLPSGVYYSRLAAGGRLQTRPMLLVK